MAFLARCPDCGKFQVSVLDVEKAINLKCEGCGGVFVPVSNVGPQQSVNWELATTMAGYEFEPPPRTKDNLVVIANLPSVYPNQPPAKRQGKKRRRKSSKPKSNDASPPPESQ